MAEKEQIFSSKIKYGGIVTFEDFYLFCYQYLTEELGFDVAETAYKEKIAGDSKNIEIEWAGETKLTDYFKATIKVAFQVLGLTNLEINQDGKKIKTNKGSVELKIKATLIRDWQGKFESSGTQKFLRSIYEKWVIPSRIDQLEGKIVGDADDFLSQAKAYLDLEGKRGSSKVEHYKN